MNSTIAPATRFNFLFLLLIVFGCHCCNSPRDRSIRTWEKYEWKTVRLDKGDEPAWVIETRKVRGTKLLEYKIAGDIAASPKACISAFKQDIYNLASDSQNKKYPTYEIVDSSKNSILTYVTHNEPFPFKDTEMSARYLFFQDAEGSVEGVDWKEAWEEGSVPSPSKKLSRVEVFRGSWRFSPNSSGDCKAVNSVRFDAKKMPQWLVSKMVVKFLVEGLENIRKMTTE
jgi:hypothetical protein